MSISGTSDWRGSFARRAEEGPGMGAESGQQRLAEPRLVPRHHTETQGRGTDVGRGGLPDPGLHIETRGLCPYLQMERRISTFCDKQGMGLFLIRSFPCQINQSPSNTQRFSTFINIENVSKSVLFDF